MQRNADAVSITHTVTELELGRHRERGPNSPGAHLGVNKKEM